MPYDRPRMARPAAVTAAQLGAGALLVLAALLALSAGFGVVWDETLYFDYTDSVRAWVAAGMPFDAPALKATFAYSPYHNVKPGTAYPATLFTTADSDSRVDPMHARKMAALVQAATSADAPILLWVESKAGHGAGKPLSKRIESDVDWLTFFMWQLGMIEGQPQ